ncbi:MAG: peptidase domain-containing ABC transporter [Oscillospiraceae bacterium]
MKIVLQHDERDCGAACLSMISAYYSLKMPISKYRELTKTDKAGTNLYGLVDGAERLGLFAEALSGSQEELLDGIQKGEVTFPFIAHTVSESAMLHYVVVFGCKNGKFVIGDPAKGKLRLPFDAFFQLWTGYIVTFQKTEAFKPGNYTRGSFLKFFDLLKGQYRKLAGVLAISLVVAAIGIMGAFVFQIVIDNFALDTGYYDELNQDEGASTEETAAEPEEHDHTNESALERFLEIVFEKASASSFHIIFVSLIVLYLLQAVIQFVRGYLIASLSRKIDIRLSLSYYNHIVDLPVSSAAMCQTGEYLSRFSDAATIRQAISGATLTLLLDSIMVIACGCILFSLNQRLFLVSLLMVLFYAVIILVYRKPVERSNRQVMENNAKLQSYFKESIDGLETVKAACADQQVKDVTTTKFHSFINSVFKSSLISISQDTLADTIELVGTVIILWIGFSMVLAEQVTVGSLITFYALLAYFTEPIKNLIELQPTIQTAFVAADRLNDILDLQKECVEDSGNTLPDISTWTFQHIDFRYGNRELTLRDINLSIKRGEKVAIVGESGSGKTTLAKLFLRFYNPEQGTIFLDGEDIKDLNLYALRQGIAYVDQNTFLFSDTIKNNLKLGNSKATDEEIKLACKISRADEFIDKLPLGYDTPLDENGANLSGGQRQRLAIARALLKKPQLLILDEATSNLDTVTEASIKNTVSHFEKDLTCIIIAHRLTTIKNCDRIYVMAQGEVVETGTHEELMKKNGKYASLWNVQ